MAKLHDIEVDDYLMECVSIIPEALQEEFCRVPGDLAYWGERYAEALKAWKLAKLQREQQEAKLHVATKEALILTGNKRPTVADIESAILQDDSFESFKLLEISAEAAYLSAKNQFTAVLTKKEMVQSLGAQLRIEMERDPVVRDSVRTARQNKADDF